MTLFLNHIFFPSNPVCDFESLKTMEKYMLTMETSKRLNEAFLKNSENIKMSPSPPPPPPPSPSFVPPSSPLSRKVEEPLPPIIAPPVHKKNPLYYPKKEDSLFWCIFIAHHGIKEYDYIGNRYANRELEEKKKIMEHIKKNPLTLKACNYKVTNVLIQEILSDLMINKKTSLATFLAFVSSYKKRVFLVHKNTYLMYNFENTGFQYYSPHEDCAEKMGFVILHYNPETQSYGIDLEITQDKIGNIINTRLCLDHYLKPLKGVSNYKVCELETMAGKLKIEYNPNIKKNDLYHLIYNECLWNV